MPIILLGEQFQSLALEARDGWRIPNVVDVLPIADAQLQLARKGIDSLLRATVRALAPPSSRYNCYGLVFASRRTNVNIPPAEEFDIRDLLRRDGFAPVPDEPAPGDIAVYVGPGGDVMHAGFVTRWCATDSLHEEFVWSKWGGAGEFEHPPRAMPEVYAECEIKYWRLSP